MRRFPFLVLVVVLVSSLRISGAATSTYLWQALDSGPSFEYNVSAFYDDVAQRSRVYFLARNADLDSEGVKTQSHAGVAPWGFFPNGQENQPNPPPEAQQWALQTTGVRIMRARAGNDFRDLRNQVYSNGAVVGTLGYAESITLGYLRRTQHDGSGATLKMTECSIGADHFVTAYPSIECVGLPQEELGYAYTSGGTGLAPRYRCNNPSIGDHFTAVDASCEGRPGYSMEGLVGFWRVGTTYRLTAIDPHAQYPDGDVSPFPDGAFLGPNSVIRDDDGTFYMSYLASAYYGAGGPFNEIFLATSTNGVTFSPVVDANGLPKRIQSYTAGYASDIDSRNLDAEMHAAFGVGAGTLMKVGSEYRIFFMDSSRYTSTSAPSCPNSASWINPPLGGTQYRWVTRTAASILDFANDPHAAGTCLRTVDASGNEVSPFGYVTAVGGLSVVYDVSQNRYWLFRSKAGGDNPNDGPHPRWSASVVDSPVDFYVAGTNSGQIDGGPASSYPYQTASGAVTDRLGRVSGQAGWYVYVGQDETCTPGAICGIAHTAITLFQPQ